MEDKGKYIPKGDKGTRTDKRRPKPHILTDRQTGEKGTRKNEHIYTRGRKPRRLTERQTKNKDTQKNKHIRAQIRQKYVFSAQYIMVSS